MFGNILSGAQNFLGNVGKTISNTVGGAVKNLTSPTLSQHTGTGGGLVPRIVTAASNFLNPQASAQIPTPQAPTPVVQRTQSQLPQLPPAYKPPTQLPPMGYQASSYQSPAQMSGGSTMQNAAATFGQAKMDQYAQLVAPHEQAITAYLASRKPYDQVYQEQQSAQGIPDKQKLLSGLESDILNQQTQLETLPKEDIARRSDLGTLSESARRRVQAMEERPIREQLLKSAQAQQGAEVGYNRALQLAGQGAQAYQTATQEGLAPLQSALDAAKSKYGQAADSIAQQLTGFSQDRADALRQYETAQQQGFQLSQAQAQQATQLKQEETQHVQTLQLVGSLAQDVRGGQTLNSVMGKYLSQGLDPDTILSLYNSYSPYGAAKEGGTQLTQSYGVSPGRFPTQ